MTKSDRIKFEIEILRAFDVLKAAEEEAAAAAEAEADCPPEDSVDESPEAGAEVEGDAPRSPGGVFSLTPNESWKAATGDDANPNLMTEEKYQELVDAHVMFKDMAADPYLASAGIASDWPCGRGCYESTDGAVVIWFGGG